MVSDVISVGFAAGFLLAVIMVSGWFRMLK